MNAKAVTQNGREVKLGYLETVNVESVLQFECLEGYENTKAPIDKRQDPVPVKCEETVGDSLPEFDDRKFPRCEGDHSFYVTVKNKHR